MSRVEDATRQGNLNEAQGTGKERVPFEINIDEHAPFDAIASTKFMPSHELAQYVSELFHGVFADFEGCMFEIPANGAAPCFSLVFNHGDYDKGATVGCERAYNRNVNRNDVVSRIRNRDNRVNNGDRYYLTEDGKDVVKTLLTRNAFNNGNPNWKIVVGEYYEGNQGIYGVRTPQYTKVNFIDLDRVCGLLFGTELDGDTVEYHVQVMSPIMQFQGQPSGNYMLSITRVSSKEIRKTYEKVGLSSFSRIIK
jgi:hypothetical protein